MNIARQTLLAFLAVVLMASCGGQDSTSPTPDVNAIMTAGVGTLAASIFQTQTALAPVATATSTNTLIPISSPTSLSTPITFSNVLPTFTFVPAPTGTQRTPTPNPGALSSGCNNLRLIEDVTVLAGTVFDPEQDFTKTWKVENNGTCDWVYLYQLVFVSGERMGGEPPRLGKVIPPGKWTQVSVTLTAPKTPGSYSGSWRLSDQAGKLFGATLGVSIVVKAPSYP